MVAPGDVGAAPAVSVRGDRAPVSQREWVWRLGQEPWVQALQARARAPLQRLVDELMLRADWTTFETMPGLDRLMEVSGWCRRSVLLYVLALRITGWLVRVEVGSTPQTRPIALRHRDEGNRRSVYALRIPTTLSAPVTLEQAWQAVDPTEAPVDAQEPTGGQHGPVLLETVDRDTDPAVDDWHRTDRPHDRPHSCDQRKCTPPWSFYSLEERNVGGSTRASAVVHTPTPAAGWEHRHIEALRATATKKIVDFGHVCPGSGAEMYAAAAQLRHQHPVLARLSVKAVLAACRPHWRAGWVNDDLVHALTHRPATRDPIAGLPHAKVQFPDHWLRSRLAAWRDDRDRVLPPHSALLRTIERHRTQHGDAGICTTAAGARRITLAELRATAAAANRDIRAALAEAQRRHRNAARAAPKPTPPAATTAAGARACHQVLADAAAQRAAPADPERAVESAQLAAQLVAAAHAHRAATHRTSTSTAWSPPTDLPDPDTDTTEQRYQRARARARAETRAARQRPHSWHAP